VKSQTFRCTASEIVLSPRGPCGQSLVAFDTSEDCHN
jgi:hypothetical protein